MKKLLFSLALFVASATCFSQSTLRLENATGCPVEVLLVEVTQGSCNQVATPVYLVNPGASVLAVATTPNGEFIHTEITDASGNQCFGVALDTDGYPTCVTCPGFGAPSIATINTGCAGCQAQTTFHWDSQCSGGSPHLHIY